MLHYDPRHVSSSIMLLFRKTNCITAASGIVTLCKRPYSMPVESGLQTVWHIPVPSVQLMNSWWWAEKLPETC